MLSLRALTRTLFVVLAAASPLLAASSVEIKVADAQGKPLPGAVVSLAGTGREAPTDGQGVARFDAVAAGDYDVAVRLAGFATRRYEIQVNDGAAATASLALEEAVHFSESLTVSPTGRDTFESYQPTSVIGGVDLTEKLQPTLGATLENEAGVNMRAFGPGPARPVIRGLDGDRVLVLENGARTGDLSSQSGDHGVTLDPANSDQIDVVRGPATLLYGSNAIGGVVNLVGQEIPTKPVTAVGGEAMVQGATGNGSAGVSGNLTGGNGRFAWRADGSFFDSGLTRTPEGDLPNSDLTTKSIGGALGTTGENGYLGASYQWVGTEYGLPIVEDNQVRLNPRRHRVDVRGERRNLGSFIDGVKFVGGFRDYRHEEKVAGEVGTSFHNRFFEGNVYLNQRQTGKLKGTVGFWGSHRDYESVGDEALAPFTKGDTFAAFAYEELAWRHFGLQFGLRYDHAAFRPDPLPEPEEGTEPRPPVRDRSFDNVSASVGLLGYLNDDVTLALNLASASRNPSIEELYNFGPHPGSVSFEVGDTNLAPERSNGLDLSLRVRKTRFVLELNAFYNRIDDFIFPFQNGEIEDEFPVVEFIQFDSTLRGLEAHLDLGLGPNFWLEVGGDTVRGELRDSGDPLPRIPPYRAWAGLRFEKGRWHTEAVVKHVGEQDRVYGFETPTEGYTLVSAHGSYSLAAGRATHTFSLRLDNLLDETYRNHLNYIKDLAPEMGFSARLVYALRF